MVLLPRGARLLAAVVALGASAGCVVPGRRPMVVRPELPARPARIQEVTVRVAEYGWQLPGATPFEKARIDGLRKKRHRYLVQALEQAGFRIADGGPTEGVVLDVAVEAFEPRAVNELITNVVTVSDGGAEVDRFQFSIPQQWTCPVGSGLCLDYGNRAFADHVVGRLMASSAVWHHVDLAYGGPIPNLDDPEPVAAVRQMELPPEPAPALVRPVVLVFDVEDRSGRFEGPALDQLSDYLVARLGSTNRFRIVPRAQLQARLRDEKQETYKACYDEACQIEIGKALAAEKTLSTKLLRIGEQCATSVTLSDLRSETTDDSATVRTACGDDAVLDGIDRLVEALVAELSPPVAESAQ